MQKPWSKIALILVLTVLLAGPATAAESTYIVQEGETLAIIAERTGFSVEHLMNNNALKSMTVEAGQELILVSADPIPEPTPTPQPVATDNTVYTLQPGDSLQSVASKLGVTVVSLKWANNLQDEVLNPGTILKIPGAGVSRSGENVTGLRIVAAAQKFLGTPYAYGGSAPGGFDCSGFTSYIFRQFNISLPRTAAGQFNLGVGVAKADLREGDLVFFKRGKGIDHVGIYAGNGQIIHSSSPRSGGVIFSSLYDRGYYSNCYYGAKRVLP